MASFLSRNVLDDCADILSVLVLSTRILVEDWTDTVVYEFSQLHGERDFAPPN